MRSSGRSGDVGMKVFGIGIFVVSLLLAVWTPGPAVAADIPLDANGLPQWQVKQWTDFPVRLELAGLEELGLTENSLIIFTSDHGEEFGEHGAVGWHSHTLYDELLRVPLLIRYPEGRHAGLSVTDQVRLLDVAPTILGAAGLTAPRGFEGIDLELVINGLPTPLPAVSQMDWPEGDPPLSVRSLNWKLYPKVVVAGARFSREEPSFVTRVVNRIGRWRNANVLFDLVDDPGELNNVLYDNFWTSEGMRKIGERVRAERPVPEPVHKVTVDDSTEERLRALGYLD